MNLLENDLKQIIIDNYDISIGYVNETDINVKSINDGIVYTSSLTANNIKKCCNVPEWTSGVKYKTNSFYRIGNKIYVCLYAPDNVSIIQPNGILLSNIILDDNYVWRYICDIMEYVYLDYVVPTITNEYLRQGCISSIDIMINSNHQINDYNAFHHYSHIMSGSNVQFVIENNQNTNIVSDVLIQDGGVNYHADDIFVLTDKYHDPNNVAIVDVEIQDGGIKLIDFTNGSNYDYLEIIIIGDGHGADLNYKMIGGVLTNVTVSDVGENYTWCKAIVLNSDKYIIGKINIEPLNGYNADHVKLMGINKYVINKSVEEINTEINFYGLHKKTDNVNKYKFFDSFQTIETFLPLENEIFTIKILMG